MPHADRLALALNEALTLPDSGDVLVLNARVGAALDELPPGRLRCEQPFRPDFDALEARGAEVVTGGAAGPAGTVVVNIERNRVASLGMIARGLSLLPPAGLMVLNGAKSDGIDSLARQVGTVLPLEGAFVKAHGRVVWLTRPAELPPEVAAWAAAAAPSRTADGFLTAPGLFSPEGPDPGSLQLAEAFGGALRGRVADLGAGWGWLAQAALARCPEIEAIDLYEADARALELARVNVPDPRAAFHWSDATKLGKVPPYDAVIANPPFHAGRAAEPDLGRAFITAAGRILKPSGRLLMVANRQLPYETALDAGFVAWRRLSEDGRYKIFAAERPRRVGRAGG
jgi:16S rRNA (guanine1207-N2)-methyltransferase